MPVRADPLFPIENLQHQDDVQARPVPGTESSDSTGHYRSTAFPELVTINSNPHFPKTVFEVFQRSLKLRSSANALGYRAVDRATNGLAKQYTWYTFSETEEHVRNIGSGLLHLAATGVIDTAGKQSLWTVAKCAIRAMSCVPVADYSVSHVAGCPTDPNGSS